MIYFFILYECNFTPCLSRVKYILAHVICCILTKENIDPSHCLWPNYLHYSSVLTYILFFVPPSFSLLFIFIPPHLHMPSFSSLLPLSLLPPLLLPSIHTASPPSICRWRIFNPINSCPPPTLTHPPSFPKPPPCLLFSPPPWPTASITLRGEYKNHHSSYLPPFWIDLSISTSAPLRLSYLSTCLTLLVALLYL